MSSRKRSLTVNTERRWGLAEAGDKTEEDGKPLSPLSRMFHQPHFNLYILASIGIGETINIEAVKAGLETNLVLHPRFSSIMVSDEPGGKNPRWVRTKVVVDDHVIIPKLNILPETTTFSSSAFMGPADQLLEEYMSSLSTMVLPLSRPLWDLHVINMRTTKAEATVILRMHHSLGDGVSLIQLLLTCMRKTSDPNSFPTLPPSVQSKSSRQKAGGSCGRVWTRLLLWVWMALALAWNTVVDVMIFVATFIFLKDTQTPIMRVRGSEFHRQQFVHRTISLDDVKVIKNAFGCTINNVLVGVTSAGLSRYLNRKYGDTANGEKKKNNFSANIRFRTSIMVNIRPTAGISGTAKLLEGGSDFAWGNHIGFAIAPVPLMICEDPLDYVRKGIQIAERKRNSLEAIFTNMSIYFGVKLLGVKAATALWHKVLRHMTFMLSNVAGPVDEVSFYGHPVVYIAPSVYGFPQAVTIHFQSYMNRMEIVLGANELTVPDPHQLLEDLAESLKLIRDQVVA